MKDRFSKQSSIYAQFRPEYPQALYDFILSNIPDNNRRVVWDCATGNGQAAKVLAQYFEKIEATDISQKQLDNAFQKDNIRYSLQKAEETNFTNNTFDLITVAQAVHWFDFEKFYNEATRVAKPNAIIAIWGYGTLKLDDIAINTTFEEFYYKTIHKYWDKERSHIDNYYKTVPFPFDKIDAPAFDMQFSWKKNVFEGYLNTWSSVQNYKNTEGGNPVEKFMEKITPFWKINQIKTVHFPIFMKLGRIKK